MRMHADQVDVTVADARRLLPPSWPAVRCGR